MFPTSKLDHGTTSRIAVLPGRAGRLQPVPFGMGRCASVIKLGSLVIITKAHSQGNALFSIPVQKHRGRFLSILQGGFRTGHHYLPLRVAHDGQEASWESIGCPMVRGLNALAVSRFTDNPKHFRRVAGLGYRS